jgi:hypothetical protein
MSLLEQAVEVVGSVLVVVLPPHMFVVEQIVDSLEDSLLSLLL